MEMKNDLLRELRGVLRLYDRDCLPVCEQYHLTRCELDVLGFLANHPGLDTARDITELRLLPKANVSQAVESLIQKEMLVRTQDVNDRRLIHLTLTSKAEEPVTALRVAQQCFAEELATGFSEEERETFNSLTERIARNAQTQLEQHK